MNIEIPDVAMELEAQFCCQKCFYSGYEKVVVGKTPKGRNKTKLVKCESCGGAGYIIEPSQFGEEILAFIKKYKDRLE